MVKIHSRLSRIYFNDQGETRHTPLRVDIAIFPLPAPHRIDGKNATSGKIPDSEGQRFEIHGPNAPAIIAKVSFSTVGVVVVSLVFNRHAVNTLGERINLFIRTFQRKTKVLSQIPL